MRASPVTQDVIPAKAGIQRKTGGVAWIPVFAGMTEEIEGGQR